MAAGTWLIGWWAVPAVALIWQLGDRAASPWGAAVAAPLAWAALLLLIPLAPLVRLTGRLAGIFQLPPPALILLVLGYAALLGWSAARLVRALTGVRPSSSQR
jgi:hypothetical protein